MGGGQSTEASGQENASSAFDGRTVVVFGSSGVGKSSLVNALAGTSFVVGSGAKGVTFEKQSADVRYEGTAYRIVDTAGLDEPMNGMVEAKEALKRAKKLIDEVSGKLQLLVMVMKQGRILETDVKNYKTFREAITGGHVPILVTVTHCEFEADIEAWATNNSKQFNEAGLKCDALVPVSFAKKDENNRLIRPEVLKDIHLASKTRLWKAMHRHSSRPPVDFVAKNGGLHTILAAVAGFMVGAALALVDWSPLLLALL